MKGFRNYSVKPKKKFAVSCFLLSTGRACDVECSGNGFCLNGRCKCSNSLNNAWFGEKCERPTCPLGNNGYSCSGHGMCIASLQICLCEPGWAGENCATIDCPGTTPCSNNGICENVNPRKCRCKPDWTGDACNMRCQNGMNYGNSSGCICNPCYSGETCNVLCSRNGQCVNGSCQCDANKGYKGRLCNKPGCPGWPLNCYGHGKCNVATRECVCEPGWIGSDCKEADCPGTPNCNNRGVCIAPSTSTRSPQCKCNVGWGGPACEFRCFNGNISSDGSCNCFPCYNGAACDKLCSGHSRICTIDGKCDCGFDGWRGDYCERKGCPGVNKDCTGHGVCLPTGVCSCDPGWSGLLFMFYMYVNTEWAKRNNLEYFPTTLYLYSS